jgi:hypothetical protein
LHVLQRNLCTFFESDVLRKEPALTIVKRLLDEGLF